MTRKKLLKNIKERFKDDIIDFYDKSPKRVYIEIKPESLVKAATYIFKDLEARFNTASGVDTQANIEILYHFSIEYQDPDFLNMIISLRVKLDRNKPTTASLAPVFNGANWIERELHDILGINFEGHPDLKKLLLPDEWPDGVYPLRKDYKEWDKKAIRDRGV
ncbi:MAG TPA: NADH-quinone oxidoreductase subunit C [Spirochaetes bacterium]|nr:NADH-quinone oxidoreductase subunit C [Spirochaetota bacterium]